MAVSGSNVDTSIDNMIAPVSEAIAEIVFFAIPIGADSSITLVVVWLLAAGIFFTIYLRFINLRGFRHAVDIVCGRYIEDAPPSGEVSHFQALMTAVAGTVGLGNIAGVAIAISLGGPGAVFWMLIAGFIGMSSKFAECTLAVKFRRYNNDGSISGGAVHYLTMGLAEINRPVLGRVLGRIFSVLAICGVFGGSMFQINQAYEQFSKSDMGAGVASLNQGWLFGFIVALLIGLVIIGGIKSIANVAAKLVPLMAVTYITCAAIILLVHIENIPSAFFSIIHGAFRPEGVAGGFIGVMVQGVRRAVLSNEAGVGTATFPHSAARTSQPASQGFVSLLEPFLDTIIVCTLTALLIIVSGVHLTNNADGIALTSAAFATVFPWFPNVLTVIVFLFAFSTMLASSYTGVKCWCYWFGETSLARACFNTLFCVGIIIGASISLPNVLNLAEAAFFCMSIINITGLYLLAPVIKKELDQYWTRLQSGPAVLAK